MIEERVSSPCISICVLDEEDICEGCYRSALEITDWSTLDDEARRAVLVLCQQRAHGSGRIIYS